MLGREFAYQALCKIMLEKTYSNLYLRNALDECVKEDQSFAVNMIYGTLQNYRYIRYLWSHLVKHMPDEKVSILIDVAIYQLVFMDKAKYAICDDMVNVAKKYHGKKVAGFVNAILRNFMRQPLRELPSDPIKRLALETSHPEWIVKMWKSQYGMPQTKEICESNMGVRKTCIRINSMYDDLSFVEDASLFKKGTLTSDSYYYEGNDSIIHSSWYQDGKISIQDESSQVIIDYMTPQAHDIILDVCSAPGSKAMHMAEHMHDQGRIICNDIYEHRLELIKQGAKRLHLNSIETSMQDGTNCTYDIQFDRILCDVPCSGYGVLARKSDIKYHMNSMDMDSLIPIQYGILEHCSSLLKENGILVYSTCTLNKKENEKQIEKFLKKHPEFILEKQQTIFPKKDYYDGFYMARLRKKL